MMSSKSKFNHWLELPQLQDFYIKSCILFTNVPDAIGAWNMVFSGVLDLFINISQQLTSLSMPSA